jgi:protein TonB
MKAYVVNLVPTPPAVGAPQGRPATPAPSPRVEGPPRPTPKTPDEPRVRETPPAPTRTASVPDLPARPTKPLEMPTRPRDAATLPDRNQPPRDQPSPRSEQKELPSVASATPSRSLPQPAGPSPSIQREANATPVTPLGRPTGTAQGIGAGANAGSDFPFAWYLQQVERKVFANWSQPAQGAEGQQVVIVFEIGRDGQVSRMRVEKSSGDARYDHAALRAVADANPLPHLPPEFKESMLRVHFGFTYSSRS